LRLRPFISECAGATTYEPHAPNLLEQHLERSKLCRVHHQSSAGLVFFGRDKWNGKPAQRARFKHQCAETLLPRARELLRVPEQLIEDCAQNPPDDRSNNWHPGITPVGVPLARDG